MQPLRVLMVTPSHSKLGDRSPVTGIWLEELVAPYYVFKDAGENIIVGFFSVIWYEAIKWGKRIKGA